MRSMEAQTPAQQIVDAFGGIRPTARAIGIGNHNNVQNWLVSGRIREHYRADIVAAAKRKKVKLSRALLKAAFVPGEKRAA